MSAAVDLPLQTSDWRKMDSENISRQSSDHEKDRKGLRRPQGLKQEVSLNYRSC